MKKNWQINIFLVFCALLVTLVAFEAGVRFFIQPCNACWGKLFSLELPPFQPVPNDAFAKTDRNEWFNGLVIDGARITLGDLWGIMREDELLGYAPQEDTFSANRWWQSNNIGARSRRDIEAFSSPDIVRLLAFGDSFTMSSRVSEEETWTFHLDQKSKNLEVVNLGVDGYGMAQSYLRYREMKNRIEHDLIILGFAPLADLERDVNSLRTLLGWKMPILAPRFVVNEDSILLVDRPYVSSQDLRNNSVTGLSPDLHEFLQKYDVFYFDSIYESPPFLGRLVTYKLFSLFEYTLERRRLLKGLIEIGSEATQLSKGVFRSMKMDAMNNGKTFLLVFIPTLVDIKKYRSNPTFRRQWTALISYTCPDLNNCIDLMSPLIELPPDEIDSGYDGTHYGPKTNEAVAEILWKALNPQVSNAIIHGQ